MSIIKLLLLAVLAVASVTIWVAPEVSAQSIPGDTPPPACTLRTNQSPFATITLCPNGGTCPVPVACPTGGGQCSRYDYRFEWIGVNPSQTVISVSADIGIRALSPTGQITEPGDIENQFKVGEHDFGHRWIRFTSNANTLNASITTDLSEPVAGTTGGKSGNQIGFCQIQTPGKEMIDPNAAVPTSVVESLSCGTIRRNVDSRGYTMSITPLTGTCTTSTDTLETGRGQPLLFADPNTRVTFQGSERYCWPDGAGGLKCAP